MQPPASYYHGILGGIPAPYHRNHTTYTQQYNILLSQNELHPEPREQSIMDIIDFVCHWQDMHDILLCLDANDNTTKSRDKGIKHFIDTTALIDLH